MLTTVCMRLAHVYSINLVPRASSSLKKAVGETPGQSCRNTPRIVEYFVTWHMIKWLFRRLFPASGGPVCFLQSGTVVQTKRRHFIVFAGRNSNELLEPFWQPWQGVSPTAILNEEKALGTRLAAPRAGILLDTGVLLCWTHSLKRPSHVKLILANSSWQTQIGVCERHNNVLANCWRKIELVSILANFSPTVCQHVVMSFTHTNLKLPIHVGQHSLDVWRPLKSYQVIHKLEHFKENLKKDTKLLEKINFYEESRMLSNKNIDFYYS